MVYVSKSSLLLFVLLATCQISASEVHIARAEIYTSAGVAPANLAAVSWMDDPTQECTNTHAFQPMEHYQVIRNITAGEQFFLNLTVYQHGLLDIGEFSVVGDSSNFLMIDTRDPYGNYDHYHGRILAHFPYTNDPFPITGQTLSFSNPYRWFIFAFNVSQYAVPGEWYIEPLTTQQGSRIDKRAIKVPIDNPGQYFAVEVNNFSFTNFNVPYWYERALDGTTPAIPGDWQNWTLFTNLSLTYRGNIPNGMITIEASPFCRKSDILGNGTGFFEDPVCNGILGSYTFSTENENRNLSCQLMNATNNSVNTPSCPARNGQYACFVNIHNTNYDFEIIRSLYMGPLGQWCPPMGNTPNSTYEFTSTMIQPETLWIIPDIDYAVQVNLTRWARRMGIFYSGDKNITNATGAPQANLSWMIIGGGGKILYAGTALLPLDSPAESLNVSDYDDTDEWYVEGMPNWEVLPYKMVSRTARDPEIENSMFWSYLLPNKPMADEAHADGQYRIANIVYDDSAWGRCRSDAPIPCTGSDTVCPENTLTDTYGRCFMDGYSFSQRDIVLSPARLIYLFEVTGYFNDRLIRLPPGSHIQIPLFIQNSNSTSSVFEVSVDPQQLSPISVNPSSPSFTVGPSAWNGLGQTVGFLDINVPAGTPLDSYVFKLESTQVTNPLIFDFLTLTIEVVGFDVEIVKINLKPPAFIYDPEETKRVDITTTIKNNGVFPQNVTLNLSMPGLGIYYYSCGGDPIEGTILLQPGETKEVGCNAFADIENAGNENILVLADLGLVGETDSLLANNHKYEIITVISPEPPAVAVPETDFAIILITLACFLTLRRWKYAH